eukprot:4023099-Lingulodinium_polyedra.AAC.1
MRQFREELWGLPDPVAPEQWVPWIEAAASHHRWGAHLRATIKAATALQQDQRRHAMWHRDIAEAFESAGAPVPQLFSAARADEGFLCYECGHTARSVA